MRLVNMKQNIIIIIIIFFTDIVRNKTLSDQLYEHFEELAPIAFLYEQGTERSHLASQIFKQFYLHNEPITNSSMTDLSNVSILHFNKRYESFV